MFSFGVILMMDVLKALTCLQMWIHTFKTIPPCSVCDIKCCNDYADYVAVMNVCLIYTTGYEYVYFW